MTAILGINAFHGDSAACLIRDGEIVAAAEEERFRRIKHWAGFPSEAIRYCLDEGGIGLAEVEHVAVNQDAKANLGKKLAFMLTQAAGPWPRARSHPQQARARRRRGAPRARLSGTESSRAGRMPSSITSRICRPRSTRRRSAKRWSFRSTASATSPVRRGAWAAAPRIEVDERVYFPHSLGIFYQALTQFLGFPHYGDEYKVMGLAPYGQPAYLDAMRRIVTLEEDGGFRLNLDYFRHHREKIEYEWDNGEPVVGPLYSAALAELLGPPRKRDEPLEQRHKDLARSLQAMYEEAFFHLLNSLHERHALDAVAIAGGCGNNSVANGKVTLKTPFREVYVQAAAGDAGGAMGAAWSVWHELGGARCRPMTHAYWGPQFDDGRSRRAAREPARVRSRPPAARSSASTTSTSSAAAPPPRSRTGRSSAGSRDAWSGARGRSATARFSATRAART